jgi:hypothetical protein
VGECQASIMEKVDSSVRKVKGFPSGPAGIGPALDLGVQLGVYHF